MYELYVVIQNWLLVQHKRLLHVSCLVTSNMHCTIYTHTCTCIYMSMRYYDFILVKSSARGHSYSAQYSTYSGAVHVNSVLLLHVYTDLTD